MNDPPAAATPSSALRHELLAAPLEELSARAVQLTLAGHGALVGHSRKVFIPLTRLCRDVCHYCTFATTPRRAQAPYLTPDEVLAIARAGEAAGCAEALFTLGDKPERRWPEARAFLDAAGHASTIDYLASMCELVLRETSLLPHVNPGTLTRPEIDRLRPVSVSMGLMLESVSERLCAPGGPHHGSPDKAPAVRLATLRAAGEAQVPFTTGLLIGIGETREERLDTLFAIRDLHAEHGHVQEVIVQNFRAKAGTRMARHPEPALDELQWTLAAARIVLGPAMHIQAPPNLSPAVFPRLIAAGLNDWGGISPLTPDHVNPEAPWPHLAELAERTASAGRTLVARTAIQPPHARAMERWVDPGLHGALRRMLDGEGFARADAWSPGLAGAPLPAVRRQPGVATDPVAELLRRVDGGEVLETADVATLLAARGADVDAVCRAADALRARTVGETVRYVVTRNINYTNLCSHRCGFCAFSKGRGHDDLRGVPYDLTLAEVSRRTREAWDRGATEVCLQGGIHPGYTGETYLAFADAVKSAAPGIHLHAFSPLEIRHGATTLGLALPDFLRRLRDAGLGSLPGTAAEVLHDDVRRVVCPDKLDAAGWVEVVEAAHAAGLPTTSTLMFGHVERPEHVAAHLLALRSLQERSLARGAGAITEFVPLPFVHMEAPLFRKGLARRGPTWRETLLVHAVARLVLHPVITHVQASWVKLGAAGAREVLAAGVDDMGGTLMNESISRAAGTEHGQELDPAAMEALIRSVGRRPSQRTTLYGEAPAAQVEASRRAGPLTPVVLTPARRVPNQRVPPFHATTEPAPT